MKAASKPVSKPAAKSPADLKSAMSLPPIPMAPTRDRNRTTRNRIRMEIPPDQAQWLTGMLETHLSSLTIDDPNFDVVYRLFNSIRVQAEKIKC